MSDVLRRAMLILDALSRSADALSARELAERIDVSKSTAQRMLQALEETGMAVQDAETRKYRLGPRNLSLGMAYREGLDLRNAALPHMRSLRDATRETVGLSVAVGPERMFIEEVRSQSELRAHSELGYPYPLWTGAPGRILLADLAPTAVDDIIDGSGGRAWEALGLPDRAALLARLDHVRGSGHDCAFDETINGVSTVAVPVRDVSTRVVAALSVSGPSGRITAEAIAQMLPTTRAAAERISRSLGA